MKALTNEQRARLEQITYDEFGIKERELSKKKNEELNDWMKKEKEKALKSPEIKRYVTLRKECEKVLDKLSAKGIVVSLQDSNFDPTISLNQYSDSYTNNGVRTYRKAYPGYKEAHEKAHIDRDAFTRARNEVMAVIWSMEQDFSACVKMIKDKVNKIK